MARLDARWHKFWQRGQTWYHFTQVASAGDAAVESQLAVEVLEQATGAAARESQLAVEVLEQATGAAARESQLAVEILRTAGGGQRVKVIWLN